MENSKKGEKYTCKLCEYKTNRKVDMEAHIMSEHKGQIEADKKTEKDKIDTQTDKDSKKAKKTFSTWWLFAGLILAYIAGYTVNIIASVSGFPLIATIVSLAIFVFVCVYILAEGIAKDKPAYRSLAIGLLGIIVGLIAQHFIKDIKKFDTNKYRNAFIISWLVSTILIVIAVLAVSVLYAKYSPVQLIQPNTVKSIPQNYFYSI